MDYPSRPRGRASLRRFCTAAWLRPDGADPGRTRFGDDLGNGVMVAWRHEVSAAYCRDLREFLKQFDTDPLSDGGNLMRAEVRWVVGHVAYGSLQVSPGP